MADRHTVDDLRDALRDAVHDPRGVDLREPPEGDRGETVWTVIFPARDGHLPWTWWVRPATRREPAQVRTWHAGATQTPEMCRDVARIFHVLARWQAAEPAPTSQAALL